MATNSLQTLIPLLSSIALLLLTTLATAQSVDNGTSFDYDFTASKPTDVTLEGDAHFPTDANVLRLTKTDVAGNATTRHQGRVVNTKATAYFEKQSLTSLRTKVRFVVKPHRSKFDRDVVDGKLVYFFGKRNFSVGGAGRRLLGVIDPSAANNPSVFSVELGSLQFVKEDIDRRNLHIGIDIGNDLLGKTVTAVVAYDAITKLITVTGTAGAKPFAVSLVRDLSSFLSNETQVGISAVSTGRAAAVYDLYSWSFKSLAGMS